MEASETIKQENYDDWIGRSEAAEDIITPRLIASFRATFADAISDTNNVPAGLHWCLAPPIAKPNQLAADGHLGKGGFMPPVVLPRRMWAGGEISFCSSLETGDDVEKISTIENIEWKQGKSGLMCFVTVVNDYKTVRGTAISDKQSIVYRAAATGPATRINSKSSDQAFDFQSEFEVSPITLFRYSALTFNAHRIHYDFPYATGKEFYPDLVIHGPLQATLLLNFAVELKQRMPRRFKYRGVAPATGAQVLQLGASEMDNGELNLSLISELGQETMTATSIF